VLVCWLAGWLAGAPTIIAREHYLFDISCALMHYVLMKLFIIAS